jgi:hypothetical protein
MVHGTPDRIVHDEPVGEGGVIVRTQGAYRKIFVAMPRQNDLFPADATLHQCAVCEFLHCNAGLQI